MDRRTMMKSLAITVWGMMALPGCGPENQTELKGLVKNLNLNQDQLANLEKLVDTFLPKTDTYGGVDLNIHHFLDKLIANCYPEDQQIEFIGGLNKLEQHAQESFGQRFSALAPQERERSLLMMNDESKPEEKSFFEFAKEQIILAYTSSEYFLTNFTNYEMIPGGYDGCVDVPQGTYKI